MNEKNARYVSIFLTLMILVLIAGCGKIGPPRIPKKTEPSPVSDLEAKLSCTEIVLMWTRPFTNTDGTALKKIEKIEIYREIKMPESEKSGITMGIPDQAVGLATGTITKTEEPEKIPKTSEQEVKKEETDQSDEGEEQNDEEKPEGESGDQDKESEKPAEKSKYFSLSKSKIYTFEKDEILELLSKSDRMKYRDTGDDLVKEIIDETERDKRFFNGYNYVYTVKVYGKGERESRDSNMETVSFALVPSSVQHLQVHAVGQTARLTWDPVTTLCNGDDITNLDGYTVYRSTVPGKFPENPLNKEPLKETEFIDETVKLDTEYYYHVRAKLEKPARENTPSDVVSLLIKDTFAPAAPAGFTVIKGMDRINLVWKPNEEKDIGGYNIYRSELPGRGYEKLNDMLVTRSFYSDTDVKQGITYFYVITAVDSADPPNESVYSKEMSSTLR